MEAIATRTRSPVSRPCRLLKREKSSTSKRTKDTLKPFRVIPWYMRDTVLMMFVR